ncbi:MAG TPA: glucokinase [Rhabdochlamydiaceae bacterium]|jgi:glucokinase|nr:glucokinase [Rhabdochlamydiaceae bacterium]
MFLIGDIGGTKAHLAYYDHDRLVKEEKFPSRHYNSFDEILKKFVDRPADKSYFALAGPIHNRKCHMTNLPWEIDADRIEKEFRVSEVHLINDLVAAGWGLKRLQLNDLFTLNSGEKISGNQAIVSIGTGLGMGGLCWDGKKQYPFASEGGHADFAPQGAIERQLWDYLHKKYDHVSIERVLSGPGLEHIFWFLVEKSKHKNGLAEEEISKQVIEQGLSGQSKICMEALQWFASLYGAAAGNAALQFLSIGGLYLAGGIASRILPVLKQGEFMKSFINKGRFQQLLEKIPVYVVLNENLPLLGALELCSLHEA